MRAYLSLKCHAADGERDGSSELYVSVCLAPAGRREINACALVPHEVRRRLDRRRRLICATGIGEVPLSVRHTARAAVWKKREEGRENTGALATARPSLGTAEKRTEVRGCYT